MVLVDVQWVSNNSWSCFWPAAFHLHSKLWPVIVGANRKLFLKCLKRAGSSHFSRCSWMMSQTRAARSPCVSALTSPFAGDKGNGIEEGGKCDGDGVAKARGDNISSSLFSTSTLVSTAGSGFPGLSLSWVGCMVAKSFQKICGSYTCYKGETVEFLLWKDPTAFTNQRRNWFL